MLGGILSFPLAIFGNYVGYRMSMADAETTEEKAFVRSFYRKLVACIGGFFLAFLLLMQFGRRWIPSHSSLFSILLVVLAVSYGGATIALGIWSWRTRRRVFSSIAKQGVPQGRTRPKWEYRSQTECLGLPLVHIRIGGGLRGQIGPVKAWIAAGDCAFGLLFAFGGMAVAPLSIGGLAIGFLPYGGLSLGAFAVGGCSIGLWSFGGLALGWKAYGACAIAWKAAIGAVAVAHDFALGGMAHAQQANNELAKSMIFPGLFFRLGGVLLRNLSWLNLIWVGPMLVWWRIVARQKLSKTQEPN
jgi:hypothetical protein